MRLAYLIAPTLLLAACGQEEKSDAKGDAPEVSINAGGDGGVKIRTGTDGSKISIGGEGVAINIDVPDFDNLDIESDFDIDGVKLYPGSKVTRVNIDANDRKGGDTAAVKLGFTAPAAPGVAADWMADEFAKKGIGITRSGDTLTGRAKDGDDFTIRFSPDGKASKGEVLISKG